MRLSRKADYALRALVSLVAEPSGRPISMNELARRNRVPKRFLEHIMLELKRHGWVESYPGRRGGYVLLADPKQVTIGAVVRAFDGSLAPIACVAEVDPESCAHQPDCRFRWVFEEVRDATARILDRAILADVVVKSSPALVSLKTPLPTNSAR